MEQYEVKGLVVRSVDYGEYDQLLTVITETEGKIFVTGKGLKSQKSRHMAACQIFCYSRFIIKKTKQYFYIAESELIESFYGLRNDFAKLSLAVYLCDVAAELSTEGTADTDLLKLTLNTLYALANRDIPLWQIKGAYEMRLLSDEGYRPDLVSCAVCHVYESEIMYLDVMNGRLLCDKCKYTEEKKAAETEEGTSKIYLFLPPPVLEALRYVLYAPGARYLSFSLQDDMRKSFASVCETYLLHHMEHSFESLKFYKSIEK